MPNELFFKTISKSEMMTCSTYEIFKEKKRKSCIILIKLNKLALIQ